MCVFGGVGVGVGGEECVTTQCTYTLCGPDKILQTS